ncbi:MAG TPA: PIN domain nuclease [Candidatus Acidoferrales bacterium]|nr:PIN domain nuclease [Candidatus Acidoferrales bacterium]
MDTSVWVDYFRGHRNAETSWLDAQAHRIRMGLADIILCEVLQGIRDDSARQSAESELLKYEIFQTGGTEFAIDAARNFRSLRARGHNVRKTVDCWIATFCILNGHSLLHRDRDFDSFEEVLGLSVIHPESSV